MKKLIGFVSTLLISTLLVGCSTQGGSEEFKPALDVNTECELRVVGDYGNFEALEAEFDKFNEYYPNVSLSYVKLDDYRNTLATVLEGNDKPNIFFSYTWMIGNEKYNPVFAHMEDLSNKDLKLNLDCIRPRLINRDENDRVLMIPVFSRTYGILVNTDLFEKEGVKIPTTWAELNDACKAFLEKGYKSPMMGYSVNSSSCLMNTIAYPEFIAQLAKDPAALKLANDLDPAAGEYMRSALTIVKELVDSKAINLEECDKISDNYNQVILRFFEGDVPMMICAGDVVSGTKKRESQSQAFIKSPFNYSFHPIPLNDKGGYFIDTPSVEFSVNKNCENLDMTNEFMRFLLTSKELNNMAAGKGLITPTKEMPLESVYSPFFKIPAERTFSPEVLGVKDPLYVQIRVAAFQVGRGELTIDEAVAKYGSFK